MVVALFSRTTLAAGLAALAACGGQTPAYQLTDFSSDPPRTGPLGGDIVVCDTGDDTLSVVDPVTQQPRWRIPIGFIPVEREGPHDVVAAPDGSAVYVTLSEAVAGSGVGPHGAHGTGTIPGYVLKLDTRDGSMVSNVQVEPNPAEMAVSPDGTTIYATHYDLGKWVKAVAAGDVTRGYSDLAVIDARTMTVKKFVPLCPGAHGVETSDDGAVVYATCATDEIAIVDVSDPSYPVRRVPEIIGLTEGANCSHCPYRLSIAPDRTIWVANLGPSSGATGGGEVRVYDPQLQAFDPARVIRACGRITAVELLAAGPSYQVLVVEQGICPDAVEVFDAGAPGIAPSSQGTLVLAASQCRAPNDMSLSADGKTGYLVCEGDHVHPGTFVFFDPAGKQVLAAFPVGVFPLEMSEVPVAP